MRWGSPHAVLTSLLGVEGALFFGALLQDFFIDKHIPEIVSSKAPEDHIDHYLVPVQNRAFSVMAHSIAR